MLDAQVLSANLGMLSDRALQNKQGSHYLA